MLTFKQYMKRTVGKRDYFECRRQQVPTLGPTQHLAAYIHNPFTFYKNHDFTHTRQGFTWFITQNSTSDWGGTHAFGGGRTPEGGRTLEPQGT
jgi:hypothetical protein